MQFATNSSALDNNYNYGWTPINLALAWTNPVEQFSGTVSSGAWAGQSQGEWRLWETRRCGGWASGGKRVERRQPLRREREAQALALFLYGTRSKTRDTTTVARYISKVKDLLFSALLEPIHIRDYTTFHRPLFTPDSLARRSHARVCKCVRRVRIT